MSQPDPGRETRIVPIKGRQVVARRLKETQLLLLARDAQRLQQDNVTSTAKLAAIARMMDIMESAIVQPEDRDYVTGLQVSGDLEMSDLMSVITVFESDDQQGVTVRRGRPRKTRA